VGGEAGRHTASQSVSVCLAKANGFYVLCCAYLLAFWFKSVIFLLPAALPPPRGPPPRLPAPLTPPYPPPHPPHPPHPPTHPQPSCWCAWASLCRCWPPSRCRWRPSGVAEEAVLILPRACDGSGHAAFLAAGCYEPTSASCCLTQGLSVEAPVPAAAAGPWPVAGHLPCAGRGVLERRLHHLHLGAPHCAGLHSRWVAEAHA
jgi:hypothetical protein